MKNNWNLFASIFQLVVGTLSIVAFFVLWIGGEKITKWIITLVLAVSYVVLGIIGIINYKSGE